MSREWPERIGELSVRALDDAIGVLEKAVASHNNADVLDEAHKALAVVRLVARMPRAAPWWGQTIDREDSSVTVGVMMRNFFEALGDSIDYPTERGLETRADHWFTRMYLPRWRRGRREYYDFLGHLMDPLLWEEDQKRALMSREQAEAERRHIAEILRSRP